MKNLIRINLAHNKTYTVGDMHEHQDELVNIINHNDITDSNIIVIGDCGVGFIKGYQETRYWRLLNAILKIGNNTLYMFRGNHDNPKYFSENRHFASNIYLLADYTILHHVKRKKDILVAGGAISKDREHRTEGVSYWEDEKFNLRTDFNEPIDIVLTHDCPLDILPFYFSNSGMDNKIVDDIKLNGLELNQLRNHLMETCSFTDWYYGHYHIADTKHIFGSKYQCLSILEFYELF